MSKLKFYNNFFFFFLFLVLLQILVKFSLYNCTFYDFGIIFRRQIFLEEKNFKDFFGGHIRFYEIFSNFFFNRINNLIIYYLLVGIQFFIYLLTFFYLRRKNKILSIIFILNPIVINPLFFDFHFEYLAVLFSAIFFYNSHKKYSIYLIIPIILISEMCAFFSIFLIWIYFKNYKVNSIGLIFSFIILIYSYLTVFYIFNYTTGSILLNYNLSFKIELLYIFCSIIYALFFLNKKFYKILLNLEMNYLIIVISSIIFLFYVFFSFYFKNINYINFNNHYFLIFSFLTSVIIYNLFKKNNYYKIIFFIFFIIFNPTILGAQFYFNEGSIFHYKNYINFNNLISQKNISRFISTIDKNKNILINNHLCNIDVFTIKNLYVFEDGNKSHKFDYIIFTLHNYNQKEIDTFTNFLSNNMIEYLEKNENYIIAKIK